jgi:hypothetical protein
METTKDAIVVFVSLNVLRTSGIDGANIEDARGVIKVMNERRPVWEMISYMSVKVIQNSASRPWGSRRNGSEIFLTT